MNPVAVPSIVNVPSGLSLRVVRAGSVPDEDHDPITRVDQFVNTDVIARPGLKPVEPQFPEAVDSDVRRRGSSLPNSHGLHTGVDQRLKNP
jgi:hypothetical protein